MNAQHSPRVSRSPRTILTALAILVALPWLCTACSNYPLQLLEARPYVEITDTLRRDTTQKVDILFVIDNSDSMKEEQDKLARNFEVFIKELTSNNVGDYQIGIITTDMRDKLTHSGKLVGERKIIRRSELSAAQVIAEFKKSIKVGTGGVGIEQPLDAVRRALSPELLNDANANQGFLRPGALLAIIFVGDEDDCSHPGDIQNSELVPAVCAFPKSQVVTYDDGSIARDSRGNPQKGVMDELTPTKTYIDFLKSLNRPVVVAGLIGDPVIYKDKKARRTIDPVGGCEKNLECGADDGSRKCMYNSPSTRLCGGCRSKINPSTKKPDANATPGFRLYEVIKAFGTADDWFPICGDDQGFQQALIRFARTLIWKLRVVGLQRAPLDLKTLSVQVVYDDGRVPQVLPQAVQMGRACTQDRDCGQAYLCGNDNQCYKDGWLYYVVDGQSQIRLSGSASTAVTPGSQVRVTYAAKTETQ